jgi:hypothetical protein
VGRRHVDAFPLMLRALRDAVQSWKGGTAPTRPPGSPTSRIHRPSSQAPPLGARELVQAGSPTAPIRVAGCRRLGHPPPPPNCRRLGQAPAKSMVRRPPWS